MRNQKKTWLISMSVVLALLCIVTIIGFRYAREYVVQHTVEAGINTMLASGEINAEDVDRLLENAGEKPTDNDEGIGSGDRESPAALSSYSPVDENKETGTVSDTETASKEQAVTRLANQIMNQIPIEEQNQLMNMVLSRLSIRETIHIAGVLLSDSSAEEKQEVKQLLYDRFTPEEIEILKSYYNSFLGK